MSFVPFLGPIVVAQRLSPYAQHSTRQKVGFLWLPSFCLGPFAAFCLCSALRLPAYSIAYVRYETKTPCSGRAHRQRSNRESQFVSNSSRHQRIDPQHLHERGSDKEVECLEAEGNVKRQYMTPKDACKGISFSTSPQ